VGGGSVSHSRQRPDLHWSGFGANYRAATFECSRSSARQNWV